MLIEMLIQLQRVVLKFLEMARVMRVDSFGAVVIVVVGGQPRRRTGTSGKLSRGIGEKRKVLKYIFVDF